MKIAVCITNHNQNGTVRKAVAALLAQSRKPDRIFVCSDARPFVSGYPRVTCINSSSGGRCGNRNSVIGPFLSSGCDAVIFIDGDTYPKEKDFIAGYEGLLGQYDLVFGTREHTDPKGLKKPASDLLTANMDNLWSGKSLDRTDLRVVSGAVGAWQRSRTFTERLDLMVTGMVSWSCNFGFTRQGLEKHLKFMNACYGRKEIFDSAAFDGGWGYEDVAMGIDALYAGLNIWISDDIRTVHKAHERSDGLFDHVKGRHLIMDRVRNLDSVTTVKDRAYVTLIIMFWVYIVGIITGLITMAASLG